MVFSYVHLAVELKVQYCLCRSSWLHWHDMLEILNCVTISAGDLYYHLIFQNIFPF